MRRIVNTATSLQLWNNCQYGRFQLAVTSCVSMAEFCGLDLGPNFGRHPLDFIEYEVKKTPAQCISEFRGLMLARPDIDFLDHSNEFIERFLIARKYKVEESFQLCVNYHLFRKRNPELFDNLNGLNVLIQQALRDGFPSVLPDRDRKGRRVLLFLAARWNHNCYTLHHIYRSILLSLEQLIKDPANQMRGFVVIVDWTEFAFKNFSNFGPKVFKTMVEGLQDCFPARIKGIHFIGQPWYVEAILAVIKPFLKDKSKSKIHLHGNNLSNLHEFVCPEILPPELGGEGSSIDPMPWTQELINAALSEAIKES